MLKKYSILALVAGSFMLLSFPFNPPDGHTGGPNEGLCSDCHSLNGSTQNGDISVTGLPATIIPNMAYVLTMTSSNPNGVAELAGFQLTILDENNNKAGNITSPSPGSHTESSGGRQYWEHFPAQSYPMSNVVMWTATWTATGIPPNSDVTIYAAGNIANGNNFSSGDLIVTDVAMGTQMGGGGGLMVSITNSTNVLCNGQNNGSATALATGGTMPYTYNWSNGGQGPTINNLFAGTYTVTVTDNAASTATASVSITQPATLNLNAPNITHVECFGGNNGSITTGANGGTNPYFFEWSNGANGTTISNLTAGPYTVTVTDDNGCTKTATYTVTQPAVINISLNNLMHESCAGEDDGSISIVVTGGVGPYFAEWSNSFIGFTNSGLEPGSYSVTVTDNNDCTKEATYTINPGGTVDVSLLQIQHVTCNGGSNGAISVSATGGVAPYTFLWSNGMSGASITGLPAGMYLVTATDAQDCAVVEGYTVNQPTAIVIQVTQTGQNLCVNDTIVDLTASASGGSPAYTAVWSDGTSGFINNNVAAGSYTITVTDMSGCTKTSTVTVTAPPPIVVTVSTTDETSSGANNGTATANATGGTPAYSYLWSNGGTTATITGLAPGTYTVTVTDISGCTATGAGQVNVFGCTLAVSLGPDFVFCNGDALLTPSVSGEVGHVSYIWSTGDTTIFLLATTSGEYCITATDEANCSVADCVIIEELIIPPLTCPVTNESAPDQNDGAINCDGAPGIVLFNWSNGETTSSISGLTPGEYCVTVTDTNSCSMVQCFNIQPADCLLNVIASQTNIGCNGDSTGVISLTVTGATPPVTFAWSNGDSSSSSTGLTAGNYSVTISDAAGCVEIQNYLITEPPALLVTIDSITDITSNSSGSISITVTGGTFPYTFDWTNPLGGHQNSEDLQNLNTSGNYSLLLTDAVGCTFELDSVFVDQDVATDPAPGFKTLKVYPVPTDDVLIIQLDHAITEAVIYGADGRVYKRIDNPFENKLEVSDLESGWYIIRVTDGQSWYIARMVK